MSLKLRTHNYTCYESCKDETHCDEKNSGSEVFDLTRKVWVVEEHLHPVGLVQEVPEDHWHRNQPLERTITLSEAVTHSPAKLQKQTRTRGSWSSRSPSTRSCPLFVRAWWIRRRGTPSRPRSDALHWLRSTRHDLELEWAKQRGVGSLEMSTLRTWAMQRGMAIMERPTAIIMKPIQQLQRRIRRFWRSNKCVLRLENLPSASSPLRTLPQSAQCSQWRRSIKASSRQGR